MRIGCSTGSKGTLMAKNNFMVNNSCCIKFLRNCFAPGIYFLEIETDNGIKFAKKS